MSRTVDTIKEKLSIVDVVGSYLKLEKAGQNFKAKCPFHNEKTPSFFLSPVRNTFYCFGCGEKGDIFTFVEKFEGLDFMGALKVLAERAGVPIIREEKGERDSRDRLFREMEEATLFFESKLQGNTEAFEYLGKRGVTKETISNWRIGFASDSWRDLFDHMKKKGWGEGELEAAGLIKKSDKGYYDRFRSRIMFPIADTSGRVIAFSGRIFGKDDSDAKYLNSPETPLFNKSETLYGLDTAKLSIRKNNFCILVEGQMDLILSHQAGFTNTVAVSGTALTRSHLTILRKICNRAILAFDSDSAGFRAAVKSAEIALRMGIEVKIADLPGGKDPADLVKDNPEDWKKAIAHSRHIIDFLLESLFKEKPSARKLAEGVSRTVLPFVSSLESKIEQSQFVAKIAERMSVHHDAIWEELKKARSFGDLPDNQKGFTPDRAEKGEGGDKKTHRGYIERRLTSLVFWQEHLGGDPMIVENIRKRVREIIGEEQLENLVAELAPFKNELLFEAEAYFGGAEGFEHELADLLKNLNRDHVKEEFGKAMRELQEAEKMKDTVRAMELLKRCQELSKQMNELSVAK